MHRGSRRGGRGDEPGARGPGPPPGDALPVQWARSPLGQKQPGHGHPGPEDEPQGLDSFPSAPETCTDAVTRAFHVPEPPGRLRPAATWGPRSPSPGRQHRGGGGREAQLPAATPGNRAASGAAETEATTRRPGSLWGNSAPTSGARVPVPLALLRPTQAVAVTLSPVCSGGPLQGGFPRAATCNSRGLGFLCAMTEFWKSVRRAGSHSGTVDVISKFGSDLQCYVLNLHPPLCAPRGFFLRRALSKRL